MTLIYGLKTCDSCRNAVRDTGGTLVDIREKPLSRADLVRFQATFGDALLNTRSTTWRGLDEDRRLEDPIDLIMAFPALMKRPVIDADGTLYLGFGPDVRRALLG